METKEYIKNAYDTAVAHGFHEALRFNKWLEIGNNEREEEARRLLMLIICEVAELIEADRKNYRARATITQFKDFCLSKDTYEEAYVSYIKGSIEEEIADILIRLFDFCGMVGLEEIPSDYDFTPPRFKVSATKTAENCYIFIKECVYPLEGIIHCDFSNPYFIKSNAWRMTKFLESILKIAAILDISEDDVNEHIKFKMDYNSVRAYKHGKKY